ncbi:MAG: DUF4258 domain-containing protein [Thermoproteota archaeon]
MIRQVVFSAHAVIKLQILRRHGFEIREEDIVNVVKHPDKVFKGRRGRFIAQKAYDEKHLIRVIYELKDENAVVVTFYPARRERYENQIQ